eukprot:2606170-Pleurochrysis_carterae.AAC.2
MPCTSLPSMLLNWTLRRFSGEGVRGIWMPVARAVLDTGLTAGGDTASPVGMPEDSGDTTAL